jgi:hypothetical protein
VGAAGTGIALVAVGIAAAGTGIALAVVGIAVVGTGIAPAAMGTDIALAVADTGIARFGQKLQRKSKLSK